MQVIRERKMEGPPMSEQNGRSHNHQKTALAFAGHGCNLLNLREDDKSHLYNLFDLTAYDAAQVVVRALQKVLSHEFDGLTLTQALLDERWRTDTRLYQPLKVGIDLAYLRALQQELRLDIEYIVSAVLGISLGELTASQAAYVWGDDVEKVLTLVINRGRLILDNQPNGTRMNTWAYIQKGIGRTAAAIQRLSSKKGGSQTLAITNKNVGIRDQEVVLVGGEETELEEVAAELEGSGFDTKIVKTLQLGALFHHPFLKGASGPFEALVYESGPVAPRVSVLSNVTGRPHTLERFAHALGEHLYMPADFASCATRLKSSGVDRVIVCGNPGALSTLLTPVFGKGNITVFNSVKAIADSKHILGITSTS